MRQDKFTPRTAAREERRQANEALGRSFCKTLAELITNSDSSAKRKHKLPQTSGLIEQMLSVPKGSQLDTASLKKRLPNTAPQRKIEIEIITSKRAGRTPREIVVIDQAEGMSAVDLKAALEDIAGDRTALARGMPGRNLFGRGLSDVTRAHEEPCVQTFDGHQLSIAKGTWAPDWEIIREIEDKPRADDFSQTHLTGESTGTAVRFIGSKNGFHIPDPENIVARLANFYMLRLIAADPNVALLLSQSRASGDQEERIEYDFPIGQVVESFSREFEPDDKTEHLRIDVLIARSEHKLEGLGPDRDNRENGLLIVDELDAVYDLTFVDGDWEKAEELRHLFGIIRINGLRNVLVRHLNVPEDPTSPLRVDRDGFNRDHPFTKRLFDFLAASLRPCYERERQRIQDGEQQKLSDATRKRIDDALKQLNKYFFEITEKAGLGRGSIRGGEPSIPKELVLFLPPSTRLIAGRQRQVLLLVRDDVVTDGSELVATATAGFSVQPEIEVIYRKKTSRWPPHPSFFCIPFLVTADAAGTKGTVTALVEATNGQTLEATLVIEDVLVEPPLVLPESIEFRPAIVRGKPNRRNNITLYVNPQVVSPGHHVRFTITKRSGNVALLDISDSESQQIDVKLNDKTHGIIGQNVLRVRIPWRGTAWNQRATVEARVKIGPNPITAKCGISLEEPDALEGGFFREVKYDELDNSVPSMFAAGTITVNMFDALNMELFGTGQTKLEAQKEFDRRLSRDPKAQQRLASLLLEEMSFRMLQQLHDDNKLPLPEGRELAAIHNEVNRHKFQLAAELYKALVK